MKTKIDLRNSTGWRNDDLLKIVTSAIDTYNTRVTRLDALFGWRVEVKPKKYMQGLRGYGYYNSRHFALYVPDVRTTIDKKHVRDEVTGKWRTVRTKGPGTVNAVDVWLVAVHEIDHCRGARHGDMPHFRNELLPAWVESFVVRPKAERIVRKPTRTDKIAAIERRIKRLETKRKRIESAIKRARRELKYQENAVRKAALAQPEKGVAQ